MGAIVGGIEIGEEDVLSEEGGAGAAERSAWGSCDRLEGRRGGHERRLWLACGEGRRGSRAAGSCRSRMCMRLVKRKEVDGNGRLGEKKMRGKTVEQWAHTNLICILSFLLYVLCESTSSHLKQFYSSIVVFSAGNIK